MGRTWNGTAVKVQNSLKNVEICPANYCKRSKYPTIGIE